MFTQRILRLSTKASCALGAAALLGGCSYRTVTILPAALPWTTAAAARDPSATLFVPDPQERSMSTKAGFHSVEVRGKDGVPQTFPMPVRASIDANKLYVESAGRQQAFLHEQVSEVALRYDQRVWVQVASLLLLLGGGAVIATSPLVILGPSGEYNVLGGLVMLGSGWLGEIGSVWLFIAASDKPPPERPSAPARGALVVRPGGVSLRF